ncbi:MAG: NAD-dependent epimerase/dehydratase family protein [Candidatus Micrarchaeota archaeon]
MEFKRALVTGSGGFIGSALCLHLKKRHIFVRGFSKEKERFSDESIAGDLKDFEALERACKGIDVVFHLAGMAYPSNTGTFTQEEIDVNVKGTLNVLEAAKMNGVKTVVYASSAYVYGKPVKLPISENHPLLPDTFYGFFKLLGEESCKYYSRNGLRCVIARIFNAFGKGQQKRVIPDLIRKAEAAGDELAVGGNSADSRDFIGIDRVVEAFLLLAEKAENGEAYNVASGTETNMRDLAELICSAFKKKSKSFKKRVTHNFNNSNARRNVADISKIAGLGFGPRKLEVLQIMDLI